MKIVYIIDSETPGIKRQKRGKGFSYHYNGETIKDEDELDRIRKLVIPPAWKEVWISPKENSHLQSTGIDVKGRKQYLYHPKWVELRNRHKYHRMAQFAQKLPAIRLNLEGKKGVYHDVNIRNPKLARMVQRCKEIPGKELFQYYDEDGKRQSIDSGMVNDYIKEISGEDFTSKDFRTWSGTVKAFLAFKEHGCAETETEKKKVIAFAIDKVATQLGNTRTVCRKYYIHPEILSQYESGAIQKYFDQLDAIEENDNKAELTKEEKIVLSILEKAV